MNTQQALAQPIQMNGLDIQDAFDTIEGIKADSSLARFQFRARNKWVNGGTNRSTIGDFEARREAWSEMRDRQA